MRQHTFATNARPGHGIPSLLLLCVLLCTLMLAACSSKQPPAGMPGETGLPAFPVQGQEQVYVSVSGGDKNFNEDLASLITATLQSDCGLNAAYSKEEADILLDVRVNDIYLAATGERKIKGGTALANTAVGTSLGLVVGSVAGYREGALIGAGIGAALGLGATLMDADAEGIWAMSADVTTRYRGDKADPVPYLKTARGENMRRDEAIFALKNQLSQDIAASMR